MFSFKKKEKETNNDLQFSWKPRTINSKGKETIDDMSLIFAPYEDYLVTKTGYLVALIEITGINLELLNNAEQNYAFELFNTFLMNTLGDNSDEIQQYLDITMPVNFEDFILSYKKRYLTEENPARKRLIASYIDDMIDKTNHKEMNTKKHILVIREPLKDKTLANLEQKARDLDEKTRNYIAKLEDTFEQHDLQAKKLFADEVQKVLKNLFNFNGN